MNQTEKLQKQFRELTAQADALKVPPVDAEAIGIDLLLKYKERCKRDARNFAKKGCYQDGKAPRKSVIQNYKKTKEYHRRYEEALGRSSRYQEIQEGRIAENPAFREELEKLLLRAETEARREVRKDYAKKLRKIAKTYVNLLPMEEFASSHRDAILKKEREMADAYIRSDRMYVTVRRTEEGGRFREQTEELDTENAELFYEQYDTEALRGLLFGHFAAAGICASSALVVLLCEEYPFLKELMASEDTGEGIAYLLQQQAAALTEDFDEDEFIREYYDFDRITELLEENPYYSKPIQEGMLRRERLSIITTGIADTIPKHYPDLFPLARAMRRHFILHIGPTNSGKTYDAIERLKNAESGVYLGDDLALAV